MSFVSFAVVMLCRLSTAAAAQKDPNQQPHAPYLRTAPIDPEARKDYRSGPPAGAQHASASAFAASVHRHLAEDN